MFEQFGFWFGLINLIVSLLLFSFCYGKLSKSVTTLEDTVSTVVEDIKELVKCSDFHACRDSNESRIRSLVTKDDMVSVVDTLRMSLENLAERIKDDRDRNNTQHKEFYSTDDKVIRVETKFEDTLRRIGSIEADTKNILAIVHRLEVNKGASQ